MNSFFRDRFAMPIFQASPNLQTQIKLMGSQFLLFKRALSYSSNMKKSLRSCLYHI